MLVRTIAPLLVLVVFGTIASAQFSPTQRNSSQRSPIQRSPIQRDATLGGGVLDATGALRVSKGNGILPNQDQQIWREYDISPYTAKIQNQPRPQQAIIDWVLRETGTEVWFSEPVGLLSATPDKLTVYHTPEMQRIVRDVLLRFVKPDAESHVMGVRLVTVRSPNWRSIAHRLMQSVEAQSPGVEAWLVTKENAAMLLAQLRKRTDFREHNSPNLLIQNGQPHSLARMRPRSFVRSVQLRNTGYPGHEVVMGQIEEGYSLQISPLLSADNQTVDAVLKCHIDQVEKFIPVSIDVPGVSGQPQRVQVQVPQLVSWRLHERFRWPANRVLLLSCGVVATPGPEPAAPLGIPNPFALGPGRADALLFLENKGRASQALVEPASREAAVPRYRGRY